VIDNIVVHDITHSTAMSIQFERLLQQRHQSNSTPAHSVESWAGYMKDHE
jgi:hypothetical protein